MRLICHGLRVAELLAGVFVNEILSAYTVTKEKKRKERQMFLREYNITTSENIR